MRAAVFVLFAVLIVTLAAACIERGDALADNARRVTEKASPIIGTATTAAKQIVGGASDVIMRRAEPPA